jgi:hypothetical protein
MFYSDSPPDSDADTAQRRGKGIDGASPIPRHHRASAVRSAGSGHGATFTLGLPLLEAEGEDADEAFGPAANTASDYMGRESAAERMNAGEQGISPGAIGRGGGTDGKAPVALTRREWESA